ncbi:hypothetical protein GCK72_022316 [Caenorhabditis remanei]|uniref:SAM domain-containing protein n=1 Tax=Caenorhabditis remanei TaxID=31234 RepID=A0A6A5FTM3_CAERE|nr:hypothetical protein GCK72_022316 [Caenorhabditis remanei]KAF1745869.1 hypothetical protein GCK72_022316 [Caenorhabditis remanei]
MCYKKQEGHVEPAADTIPPAGHTHVKIWPVVENVILPTGNKWDYEEWTTADILDWLQIFYPNPERAEIIAQKGIDGSHLYRCFLDRASSMAWCKEAKISPGTAMKIRMTFGRVHNIICGYEQYDEK